MRISVNLATRPYSDLGPALKRLRIAMAVLVVLGIALGLGLRAVHQKAEVARATESRVQSQIDAINQERLGYQNMMRQPANALLLNQAAALNQLFDEKTFSWTLAMEDLETVLPGGVQVVSLEPSRDPKTGRITLKLRVIGARDRADDLVQNLEHSRYFLLPHIVSESSESTGGPNEKLEVLSASNRFNFELLADYNSAAPMEGKAEKKSEKPQAAGERAGQKSPKPQPQPIVHPIPNSVTPGASRGQFAPSGPQRFRPNGNPVPVPIPNTGGPR
jgi:type IV pilus assembly protein PilN